MDMMASASITEPSVGEASSVEASLVKNDVLGCKCHSTKERKGNRGTVQCSNCGAWSHLACYNLITKDAKSSSFIFVCDACAANSPDPVLASPQPLPTPRERSLSEPLVRTDVCSPCSSCSEVPKLRETVNDLVLQVRSLQLQLITLRDTIEKPQPAWKNQVHSYQPAQSQYVPSSSHSINNPNNPVEGPLRSNNLPHGSREFFISPTVQRRRPETPPRQLSQWLYHPLGHKT